MNFKNKKNYYVDKTNGKKKIIVIVLAILVLLVSLIIFINMYYKNKNVGNNMSNKNIEEIEKYILDISSYKAKIEVETQSNKNSNKYVLEQEYKKDSYSQQTVLEPSNIEGMTMRYENNTLKLNYSKLNLTTIYEKYNDLMNNFLWINAFVEDYKSAKNSNNASIKEDGDLVIMQTKTRNSNNKYVYSKELTIDKKTGKPTKLIIQDINKKNLVYISYNEIAVNGLK